MGQIVKHLIITLYLFASCMFGLVHLQDQLEFFFLFFSFFFARVTESKKSFGALIEKGNYS